MLKSIRQVLKYGGHTELSLSQIKYGQILAGKRVLITGGGSGIGLEIARKFISEGALVVISARSLDKLKDALDSIGSDRLSIIEWDISSIAFIANKVQEVENLAGGDIDILVNNAGVLRGANFPNVTEEDWDYVYSINSKGLLFLTQHIAKRWINRSDRSSVKKILNISSQAAFIGATYPYRMSKWDVAGLTQGLGLKLAPHNIIVNGIAPGIIATQMQKSVQAQGGNTYSKLIPLGRNGSVVDISELACFMGSNASNFIVGQTIVCDGGYTLN